MLLCFDPGTKTQTNAIIIIIIMTGTTNGLYTPVPLDDAAGPRDAATMLKGGGARGEADDTASADDVPIVMGHGDLGRGGDEDGDDCGRRAPLLSGRAVAAEAKR